MGCWEVSEIIMSTLFFIVCFATFVWRLTRESKETILLEYETWCLLLQIAYYITFLLNGFFRLFNKDKEDDNACQRVLKSQVFKFIWPFVLNTVAVFYLGYFFGWFSLDFDNKDNDFYLSFFLHGICQVGFVLDLFLFQRVYRKSYIFDFLFITGIYVLYCFLLFITKPEIKTYHFLYTNSFFQNIQNSNLFIICMMIASYCVYLNLYIFYMYVVKFKSGVSKLLGGDEEKKRSKSRKKKGRKKSKKSIKKKNIKEEKEEKENEENKEKEDNEKEDNEKEENEEKEDEEKGGNDDKELNDEKEDNEEKEDGEQNQIN